MRQNAETLRGFHNEGFSLGVNRVCNCLVFNSLCFTAEAGRRLIGFSSWPFLCGRFAELITWSFYRSRIRVYCLRVFSVNCSIFWACSRNTRILCRHYLAHGYWVIFGERSERAYLRMGVKLLRVFSLTHHLIKVISTSCDLLKGTILFTECFRQAFAHYPGGGIVSDLSSSTALLRRSLP